MTEQLTQRDREAAVRLLLDILNQDAERLPRRLRALGVRYPRARWRRSSADRLGVIVQRYSASRSARSTPARCCARSSRRSTASTSRCRRAG